jgi:hypothetical protein
MRREAPICNGPDRQVGVNVSTNNQGPKGRNERVGASDLTHNLKTSLPRPNSRSYLISGPSGLTAYPEIATRNGLALKVD